MYAIGVAVVALIAGGTLLAVSGTGSDALRLPEQERSDHEPSTQGANLAVEREAQSTLRNALVAAKTHYVDASTYEGFTPRMAAKLEPSVDFSGDRPATPGTVTINLATDDDVVLSTAIAGEVFCISEHDEGPAAGTFYGRMDGYQATSAADCTGGW